MNDDRPTVHLTYNYETDRFSEYVASRHCSTEHPHLIVDRKHDDTAWCYFHLQNRSDTKEKAVLEAMRDLQRMIDQHRRYVKTYHTAVREAKAKLARVEAKAKGDVDMKGWAYTQFDNVWKVYEVQSPAVDWRMYGDSTPQDYHDAVFYQAGYSDSAHRTLDRRQLFATEKEAITFARRSLDLTLRSLRATIKSTHTELKVKSKRLADLDAQSQQW